MAIYLIRYLNVPPNTISRHGQRAPPSGSDTRNNPAGHVRRSSSTTARRARSEELDAGLARHLPRLWRRLGGCLERRKQGRALGSWPVRRRSLGQERRSSRATQEGQIFPGLARYHVAPAVAASSSQPAGSASQPELPRRPIGTIIQEFDTVADDHGLRRLEDPRFCQRLFGFGCSPAMPS
jgi:hypothetical protein